MANNNYDRMKMGEKAPVITDKAKATKAKRQSKATKLGLIPVVAALAVLFLGLVGGLGKPAQAALLGSFGWAGVAYCLLGVAACVLVWCNFKLRPLASKKKRKHRALLIAGIVSMALVVLVFLSVITTISAYLDVATDGFATYRDYLSSVYRHGSETAGGVLIAVFSHWMLAYMGARIAEIVLAVLFFAILLGMIYPFWFVEKKERVIADENALTSSDGSDHTKLFVDTVDGKEDRRRKDKDKKKSFDYSFPNNEPIADEVSEVDQPEAGELELTHLLNTEKDPQNRKQMAAEFLFSTDDRRAEELLGKTEPKEYDASEDRDGPLYFHEKNLHAEWGKRQDLPEAERKQNSRDILFGDLDTEATPMPTPSVKRSAESRQARLDSGVSTVETIYPRGDNLPRKKKEGWDADFQDLTPSGTYERPATADKPFGQPVPPQSGAFGGAQPTQPIPQQAQPYGQPYGAPYVQQPVYGQYPYGAPYGQQPMYGQPPYAQPQGQGYQGQQGYQPVPPVYGQPYAPYGQPQGQQPAQPIVQPQQPKPFPSAPQDKTGVSDHNLKVEEAHEVKPKEYPTFVEEDEDYEDTYEQEEEEEQEPAPLFAEREDNPDEHVYGGFVERKVEPKEEEPEEEPFKPTPRPEVRQQARAYQPPKPSKPKPYQYPPLNLLKDYPPPMDIENYERMYATIEEAFASFQIPVQVLGHTRGPTFTQYAVRLADGISVKRVNTLEEDIVRKLRLDQEITIVPSVPGMDAIGVEVVNKSRATVSLKPLLTDPCFRKPQKLFFVLGVDVRGEPFYCDILNGPHMLIAGSSGSGKSVCLNTLICSLLFNYSPEYVKFILIDPKGGVEMDIYNDVPHNLLGKAATNPSSTIKALDWAIDEMERRYNIMKDEGVRNIGSYNDIIVERGQQRLPYILVIIDELADMMKMSKKMATDLEQRIARLTAKARACGIHVIVATQRPSVDVITGTIKNNIPTRIAFRTASQIDSKTILNKGCADKLYGRGDMYYMGNGVNELRRLQAPMLSDEEVGVVTDYIRDHNEAQVDASITNIIFREEEDEQVVEDMGLTPSNMADGTPGRDSLFENAVRFAAQQGVVSISKLQREFRLGFSRAGFLVDEMEKRGVIEPAVPGSSRPRRVVMTLDQINNMFGSEGDE